MKGSKTQIDYAIFFPLRTDFVVSVDYGHGEGWCSLISSSQYAIIT